MTVGAQPVIQETDSYGRTRRAAGGQDRKETSDAEICWAAPGRSNSIASMFAADQFIIGDPGKPTVYGLRLDGNISQAELPTERTHVFNHNIDPGKYGFWEVDAASGAVTGVESNLKSMTAQNTWNYNAGKAIYSPVCSSAYEAGIMRRF